MRLIGWPLPPAVWPTALGLMTVWTWVQRKEAVCWLYDVVARLPRKRPGKDVLSGGFKPVQEEMHVTKLQVEGTIPADLEGVYMRNGPNPYLPPIAGYHWFDGDGMIHAVKLSGGKAVSYANHSVRTNRLKQEIKRGKPLHQKAGDLFGLHGLLLVLMDELKKKVGVWSDADGNGTANTALLYHNGRVLALHEGDLPYQVRVNEDGSLETVGRLPVGGTDGQPAWTMPFTAHPKVDPITGECFFFGYNMMKKPYCAAGMMDSKGTVTKEWLIDVPFGTMMHDCGLTKNYAVLLHMPLVFNPEMMIKKGKLPFIFDKNLPTRLGLLRRDAPGINVPVTDPKAPTAPVTWFEIPAGFMFHVANAWEEPSGVVRILVCHFPHIQGLEGNDKPPPEDERQKLFEYTMDPATGKATVTQLGDEYVDFPVVNPNKACYKTRYLWASTFRMWLPPPRTGEQDGIAKYDMDTPTEDGHVKVTRIKYPDHCCGQEAVFVPRPGATEEDDGWLLVYVYNTILEQSSLNIYDAKTMDNTPLARVILPQRVPYGFHGMFVNAEQLKQQKTSL